MTAVNLASVLKSAQDGHYALAGLVVLGWEDALAFVEAAEETGIPVILQAGPGCRAHMPIPVIGAMLRYLADQARIPVVCHIDHATTIDECRQGIEHGFTSVMYDGSALPIGENITMTRQVVEIARRAGVSVEGEVGFVGYAEGRTSLTTMPEEAALFDAESGADALAISVGNTHLQTQKTAFIDMEALRAIEAVTHLPLVLHGGSGIPPLTRAFLAANSRICKFNIGTELRMVFGEALRASVAGQTGFDRNSLLKPVIPAMRDATIPLLRELAFPAAAKVQSL